MTETDATIEGGDAVCMRFSLSQLDRIPGEDFPSHPIGRIKKTPPSLGESSLSEWLVVKWFLAEFATAAARKLAAVDRTYSTYTRAGISLIEGMSLLPYKYSHSWKNKEQVVIAGRFISAAKRRVIRF